jgi:hypothetical protein
VSGCHLVEAATRVRAPVVLVKIWEVLNSALVATASNVENFGEFFVDLRPGEAPPADKVVLEFDVNILFQHQHMRLLKREK